MKNVLVVLSAFVLTSAAYAADNTEFKWNAEIRARYISEENPALGVNNSSTQYQQSYWAQRDILGVTMTKGEKLTAYFKLLHTAFWGADFVAQPGTDDGLARPSASNKDNLMMLHEAWAWWKMNDNMSLKIGRGGMKLADGLLIGLNEWDNVPLMFEGVLGIYDTDFAKFAVFGVKGADYGINGTRGGASAGTAGAAADPQANFYGVSVDAKNLPEVLKMANVHVMKLMKDTTQTNATAETAGTEFTTGNIGTRMAQYGRDQTRYGIVLGGDTSNIDYKATYEGHMGKYRGILADYDGTGSMFHITAGYSLPEMMKFHVGAVYHTDSGEDNMSANKSYASYDPFYYDVHNSAGLMDIFRFGNLTFWGFNAKIEPMEDLEVGAAYLMFNRTKSSSTAEGVYAARAGGIDGAPGGLGLANNGEVTNGASVGNAKSALGTELDLYATKKYDGGITTSAHYSLFTVGDYFKSTTANVARDVPNASEFMLEAKLVF